MNEINTTTTFISTRAWVRDEQLKEKRVLQRRERLCNALNIAKWIITVLTILTTFWATVWLWYFAVS
jgi:hypothetical protein